MFLYNEPTRLKAFVQVSHVVGLADQSFAHILLIDKRVSCEC
jgi:hypothetical protein